MKIPTNINGNNLITFLQNNTAFRMADLFTITLKNTAVLRYTTWDSSLVVSGNTFLTGPPNFQRTAIEETTGMDVATIELDITASSTDLLPGSTVPFLQATAMGLLDGAAFRIDRLFIDTNGNQIGTVIRFSGFVGPADEIGRTHAKITVNSGTQLLQMQLPSIIMQPGCTNTLFDAGCGLVKSNLLTFSQQLDNAAWSKSGFATVTPNAVTDPLGGQTADSVLFSGSTPNNLFIFQSLVSPALNVGLPYTFSCYMKAPVGSPTLNMMIEDIFANRTLGDTKFTLTQNWQRFSVTAIIGTGATGVTPFWWNASDQVNPYHIWGAQCEIGPAATAYNNATLGVGAAFSELNTVQAPVSVNKLVSLSPKGDTYYDNGQIVFVTGPNAGLTKAIKSYFGRTFFFNSPLPFSPNAGDMFVAYPGCDKQQSTCGTSKFNNLVNFGGFPYVPVPETAI
jgi:hypothetical protein